MTRLGAVHVAAYAPLALLSLGAVARSLQSASSLPQNESGAWLVMLFVVWLLVTAATVHCLTVATPITRGLGALHAWRAAQFAVVAWATVTIDVIVGVLAATRALDLRIALTMVGAAAAPLTVLWLAAWLRYDTIPPQRWIQALCTQTTTEKPAAE